MPGDYENQLRCTRGFYAYLLAHPGKKLLFMGPEIGQWHEWDSNGQLDWYLLEHAENQQLHAFFKAPTPSTRRRAPCGTLILTGRALSAGTG